MPSFQEDTLYPEMPTSSEGRRWLTLLCVGLGIVAVLMENGSSAVVAPALLDVFSTDISTVVWFISIYVVAGSGLMLIMGWLGDAVGRRRMYLTGLLIFTLGLGLVAVAQDLPQLFAFRVLQAVGAALCMANFAPLVTTAFPSGQRGKGIGLMNAFFGIGLVLGPVLSGFVLEHLDWRAVYWIRVPGALITFVVAALFLRELKVRNVTQAKGDYLGIVLVYVSVSVLLLALNQMGRMGLSNPIVWSLVFGSGVLFFFLVIVETRAERPVLDLSLFRNRVFTVSQITLVFHFLAIGALNFTMPFYLLGGLGMTPSEVGTTLGVVAVALIVMGPVAGLWYDAVGSRLLTAVGMLTMSGGFLLLWHFSIGPHWVILLVLALIGVGSAVYSSPNVSAFMGAAPPNRLGTASGLNATILQVAMSAGATFGGAMFVIRETARTTSLRTSNAMGENVLTESVIAAFGDVALILAILLALATPITWARGRA